MLHNDWNEVVQALAVGIDQFAKLERSKYLKVVEDIRSLLFTGAPEIGTLDELREQYRTMLRNSQPSLKARRINDKISKFNALANHAADDPRIQHLRFSADFPKLEVNDCAPDKRRFDAFTKFAKFCSRRRIHYSDLDETVFRTYRSDLESRLQPNVAETRYGDLRRFWIEHSSNEVLRKVDIPRWDESRRRFYGLPQVSWPSPWANLINRFESAAAGLPREGDQPWPKHLTLEGIRLYRRNISEFLGMLQVTGRDPECYTPESVFSNASLVRQFVRWHIDVRCQGHTREYHPALLKRFARLGERLCNSPSTAKDLRRTAASMEGDAVRDRIAYEDLCYADLERKAMNALEHAHQAWLITSACTATMEKKNAAMRYRNTLLICWLLRRPLRASNVALLQVGKQVKFVNGSAMIELPAHETKGKRDWAALCPEKLIPYIYTYCKTVLPFLDSNDFPHMFPSKSGHKFSRSSLWRLVKKTVPEVLGITCSTHDFRGLVITLYLLEYPHEVRTARDVLGHRRLETTIKHYVHLTPIIASRRVPAFLRKHCPSATETSVWRTGNKLVSLFSTRPSL
jgi:site-specific recombinase XerD